MILVHTSFTGYQIPDTSKRLCFISPSVCTEDKCSHCKSSSVWHQFLKEYIKLSVIIRWKPSKLLEPNVQTYCLLYKQYNISNQLFWKSLWEYHYMLRLEPALYCGCSLCCREFLWQLTARSRSGSWWI